MVLPGIYSMETNTTKNFRIIRENYQMESNDNNIMITVKEAKEILQKNFVAYKSFDKSHEFTVLGMDDKNNLFTIKQQKEKIQSDNSIMKTHLIEVRFTSYRSDYSEYTHELETETIYESVGLFDNINTAWNVIHKKIAKYHTNLEQYNFRLIEINKSHKSYGEDEVLQKYEQKLREQKQQKIEIATLGFRCSECNELIKSTGNSHSNQNKQSNHAQTHKKNGTWAFVDFTRIFKDGAEKC